MNVDKVIAINQSALDKISSRSKKHLERSSSKAYKMLESYHDFSMRFYWLARHSNIKLLNKLWIWGYSKLMKLKNDELDLLDVEGVHIIVSLQGGGKSSLMFHKCKDYMDRLGKAMYVNTRFEKPKYDEVYGYDYVYNKLFTDSEFFANKELIKKPNTDYFCGFVFDEEVIHNNPRKNSSNDHNDSFLGRQELFAAMRPLGMKYMLIATQVEKIDIQAYSIARMIHEVEVVKGIDYDRWMETGDFKGLITILGWNIKSYKPVVKSGKFDKVLIKSWFKKCEQDLSDFDTFSVANDYAGMQTDRV